MIKMKKEFLLGKEIMYSLLEEERKEICEFIKE